MTTSKGGRPKSRGTPRQGSYWSDKKKLARQSRASRIVGAKSRSEWASRTLDREAGRIISAQERVAGKRKK